MRSRSTRAGGARFAWLVAGAVVPFGGLIARPFALLGAAMVLFAFVIAAVDIGRA